MIIGAVGIGVWWQVRFIGVGVGERIGDVAVFGGGGGIIGSDHFVCCCLLLLLLLLLMLMLMLTLLLLLLLSLLCAFPTLLVLLDRRSLYLYRYRIVGISPMVHCVGVGGTCLAFCPFHGLFFSLAGSPTVKCTDLV